MKSILFIFLVSFGALASAPSPEILQKLVLPLKTCPEKIWPGYQPLKDADFILNVPSENKSYVIKEDGSIEVKTSEEWGEEGLSPYSYGENGDRKFVIANLEDYESEEQALQTFFHEGFHFLGQKGIMPSTDRDELFPIDYEARIARAMQLRNMRSYLSDKMIDNLHKAAYWENWIKKNRTEEHKANQDWDVLEGSAEFVGLMSSAVMQLGCEASDEDLLKKAIELSEPLIDTSERSGQSYNAGLYGYVVSRLNQTNEVFQELNKSPLSVVLLDCPQTEEEPDLALKDVFKAQFSYVEEAITYAVEELENTTGLVAIPGSAMIGAFQSMGFYTTVIDGSKAQVMLGTTMTVSIQGKTFQITEKNFWDSKLRSHICGQNEEFMLVPKESVPQLTNLKEDGEYLGKKIYCPEPINP